MRASSLIRKRLLLYSLIALATIGSLVGYGLASGVLNPSLLVTPGGHRSDQLIITNYTITSDTNQANPTVLTLWLKNVGNANADLSTLTLQDLTSSGNPATFQIAGQSIASLGTGKVSVDTLNSGFYFMHGHSYTFQVTTSIAHYFFTENYA